MGISKILLYLVASVVGLQILPVVIADDFDLDTVDSSGVDMELENEKKAVAVYSYPIGLWPFTQQYQGKNIMGTGDAQFSHIHSTNGLNNVPNTALLLTGSPHSLITIPMDQIKGLMSPEGYTVTMYIYVETFSEHPPILEVFNPAINKLYFILKAHSVLHAYNEFKWVLSSAGVIEARKWYHVAVVSDNSINTLSLYRNMELVAQTTYDESVGAFDGNAYLGWSPRIPDAFQHARLYCLQIFNVVLTPTQIQDSSRNCPNSMHGCYDEQNKYGYNGAIAVTTSGTPCQNWKSSTPHRHIFVNQNDKFPEKSVETARNYCRNPDGKLWPWCYTTNPAVHWEYCDVPVCVKNSHGHIVAPSN